MVEAKAVAEAKAATPEPYTEDLEELKLEEVVNAPIKKKIKSRKNTKN